MSSVSAEPLTVPVCMSSTVGRPASVPPGAAVSENVAVELLAGAVNDLHRAASGSIPATNAFASDAAENW